MFGRRKKPRSSGGQNPKGNVAGLALGGGSEPPETDMPVGLQTPEAEFFIHYIASVRGYPRDAWTMISDDILWLETRGLPAFTPFAQEAMAHHPTPLRDRSENDPIVAGVQVASMFDEMIQGDQTQIACVGFPDQAFLLLPRMARMAQERGQTVLVALTYNGAISARCLVDQGRLAVEGDIENIVAANGIGLSRYTRTMPQTFLDADRDIVLVPKPVMEQVILYTKDHPAPSRAAPLAQMLGDEDLATRLQALSKGELSTHAAIAFQHPDSVLMTTRDSANGKFCQALTRLGWMAEVDDPSLEHLPPGTSAVTYQLTDLGRHKMPEFLTAMGVGIN